MHRFVFAPTSSPEQLATCIATSIRADLASLCIVGSNLLERLNEEIKRRTHVVRIVPNAASCLRLIRALAVEMHENWLDAHRYLNMDDLREDKKEALRMAA
jgi:transposase-like protein